MSPAMEAPAEGLSSSARARVFLSFLPMETAEDLLDRQGPVQKPSKALPPAQWRYSLSELLGRGSLAPSIGTCANDWTDC